jgi:hypothetical protein
VKTKEPADRMHGHLSLTPRSSGHAIGVFTRASVCTRAAQLERWASWNTRTQIGQGCEMKNVIVAVVALFLSGASVSRAVEYPSYWPEISDGKQGAVCPDLSGTYKNSGDLLIGDDDHKSIMSAHLAMELLSFDDLMSKGIDPKWADKVVIKNTIDADLDVVLLQKGKEIYRAVLNKNKDFSCAKKYIVMQGSSGRTTHIRVEHGKYKNQIGKAVDGSVIIRYSSTDYGLFAFLIPYRETSLWWYRFEPSPLSE